MIINGRLTGRSLVHIQLYALHFLDVRNTGSFSPVLINAFTFATTSFLMQCSTVVFPSPHSDTSLPERAITLCSTKAPGESSKTTASPTRMSSVAETMALLPLPLRNGHMLFPCTGMVTLWPAFSSSRISVIAREAESF